MYTVLVVWLLAKINLWEKSLLKDTILWFCFAGFATLMESVTAKHNSVSFSRIVADNIKVIIILEFLVNTYTFPLGVELVIVPILAFSAMVDAYAEYKGEHTVVKLMKGLQVVLGLAILIGVTAQAISDFANLGTFDTIRAVGLAPLLSILFLPFLYVFLLYSTYDLLFVMLKVGPEKDKSLRRYAKLAVIRHCGANLSKLQRFDRSHRSDFIGIHNANEVDKLFAPESLSRGPRANNCDDTQPYKKSAG
jgi:hypothetical protein